MRKLLNGIEVTEYDEATTLKVYTKCPEKYKLTDMETGEEYIGLPPNTRHPNGLYNVHWKKINA